MSIFCYKKLTPAICLGEKFKQAREDKGLKLEEASLRAKIPTKYLAAIEAGLFSRLPKAKPYRLAYIRQYSEILGLDANDCAKQLLNEDGLSDIETAYSHRKIKLFPFVSISILLRNILIGGFVLLFAFYFIWQINGVLKPPKLEIYFPPEGYISPKMDALIQGEATPESKVTINGQDAIVNDQGKFETKIDLTDGVNTITVSATKKHGKTTTIVRHIVAKTIKNTTN